MATAREGSLGDDCARHESGRRIRSDNDIIKLPGGDRIHVKVGTQDSGGALFKAEQPIERRGSGPPSTTHENKTSGSKLQRLAAFL
jgi:hypothetical protein